MHFLDNRRRCFGKAHHENWSEFNETRYSCSVLWCPFNDKIIASLSTGEKKFYCREAPGWRRVILQLNCSLRPAVSQSWDEYVSHRILVMKQNTTAISQAHIDWSCGGITQRYAPVTQTSFGRPAGGAVINSTLPLPLYFYYFLGFAWPHQSSSDGKKDFSH